MKTNTILLFASAAALGFTITTANATDIAASPRFQQKLNERNAAARADSGPNLVSNGYLGAAAKSELNRPKVAPNGTGSPNLVGGNYPGVAGKNPYFRPAAVEIAPLKEKGK